MDPVVVYGATGFTGQLVTHVLADRDVPMVLAGRNELRLRALRARLHHGDAEVRTASTTEPGTLQAAISGAGAVVNLAGPFGRVGDAVVRAAIEEGVPYVDPTGEQVFAHRVRRDLHEVAMERGVPVVNMLGFEYALGDLGAAILVDDRPGASLEVVYKTGHGGASLGTKRSIVRALSTTGFQYWGRKLRREATASVTRDIQVDDRVLSAYSFPGGEVLTVPRHQDVERVRTFMVAHPRTIAGIQGLTPAARLLLRGPVLNAAEDLLAVTHRDPADAERRKTEFRVLLECILDDGAVETLRFRGRDPYGLTAELLAEAAIRFREGRARKATGVVAAAEVLEPRGFLEAVQRRHRDLAWQLEDGER